LKILPYQSFYLVFSTLRKHVTRCYRPSNAPPRAFTNSSTRLTRHRYHCRSYKLLLKLQIRCLRVRIQRDLNHPSFHVPSCASRRICSSLTRLHDVPHAERVLPHTSSSPHARPRVNHLLVHVIHAPHAHQTLSRSKRFTRPHP
jgi:hypothetical protein